jgi:transcriptional regulator with PAS, ATPase and Fis domain
VEREAIAAALREHDSVTAAAAALGISRRALYERMRRYDLHREAGGATPPARRPRSR